jgi:hypothetical protein
MVGRNAGRHHSDADIMADLISQADAARLRGVTTAAIADLVRRGRLSTVEVGGRAFLRRSEVESFERVRKGWPKGKARKSAAAKRRGKRAS